jgi:hypothetical protein
MALYSTLGNRSSGIRFLLSHWDKLRLDTRRGKTKKLRRCNKIKNEDLDLKHGASNQQWQGTIKTEGRKRDSFNTTENRSEIMRNRRRGNSNSLTKGTRKTEC